MKFFFSSTNVSKYCLDSDTTCSLDSVALSLVYTLCPSHTRAELSHDFKIGRSDPIFSPMVRSSDPIFILGQIQNRIRLKKVGTDLLSCSQITADFLKSRKSMFLTCNYRTIIVQRLYDHRKTHH